MATGLWCVPWRSDHADLSVSSILPFFIDTAGNALDLYDTIEWWDDANHLVNWAILTAGAAVALTYLPLGRLNRFALGVGFGAVTAIGWELAEYITFIKDSPACWNWPS